MAISEQEFRRLKESIEILAGMRGSKDQAAVRRAELGRLQNALVDFNNTAEAIAKAISAELNASITALQGKDGQHDQQIKALQDADVATGKRLDGVDTTTGKLRTDLDALSGKVTANAKIVTDTKTAAGAVTVPAMTSADATAAPTAAQYNALRADVTALRKAVLDLQKAISS